MTGREGPDGEVLPPRRRGDVWCKGTVSWLAAAAGALPADSRAARLLSYAKGGGTDLQGRDGIATGSGSGPVPPMAQGAESSVRGPPSGGTGGDGWDPTPQPSCTQCKVRVAMTVQPVC
jgi:hypothetical protein